MGRPPLYMIRIHTSLSAEALNRMDKIVGEKGRAAFIRKAVDQLLDAVEHTKELEAKKSKGGE
ncbi:hypothetical protein [Devosia sp. Naph2]|uniref:hypothetical protein n=1 Tax=Devosia polycyclovorans TaxID=3345148 RepID=UPI0035CF9D23